MFFALLSLLGLVAFCLDMTQWQWQWQWHSFTCPVDVAVGSNRKACALNKWEKEKPIVEYNHLCYNSYRGTTLSHHLTATDCFDMEDGPQRQPNPPFQQYLRAQLLCGSRLHTR